MSIYNSIKEQLGGISALLQQHRMCLPTNDCVLTSQLVQERCEPPENTGLAWGCTFPRGMCWWETKRLQSEAEVSCFLQDGSTSTAHVWARPWAQRRTWWTGTRPFRRGPDFADCALKEPSCKISWFQIKIRIFSQDDVKKSFLFETICWHAFVGCVPVQNVKLLHFINSTMFKIFFNWFLMTDS